jgi:hypothetical protein
MATVTLRVLEGLERGRTYGGLATPVTIGREDDNDIQLNDDRVSRFHAKLQDDGGRVILTDLDSTNGTRVNGHPVQMKVLQMGDLVMVGRCVLLFGDLPEWEPPAEDGKSGARQTAILDSDNWPADVEGHEVDFLGPPQSDTPEPLFPRGAPPAPVDLKLSARAEVSDVLAYLHDQIGQVLADAQERFDDAGAEREMVCPKTSWQRLVSLQATLATYLRQIANPE